MKKLREKNIYYYIIILLVAIAMSIPLFNSGIHTGHDGDFHISRTIGTMEQIVNGQSPYIVSRFSNNLGFGWNLFYPPVSTVINLFFAFLTSNVVIAMKLFIFCTFLFSGIAMFKMVKTISKNNTAALISSVIYMCAPYRLLNAYTRVAVGEMASFIFIPIIFRGVYNIINGDIKKSYLYVLGTIGLVLSHNISTMLIFILGFFYVLINIKKLKDKKILKTLIISTLIIVLAVSFFEIPLLEQKSSCEYEVFRYGKMYSKDSVMGHALNPLQLLLRNAQGADSSMYFCIGIPIIISLILTFFVKIKDTMKKDYKFFYIVGVIATIMSTFLFPWTFMPDILLMVQFPWRLLGIVVFCFSIIGGINIAEFIEKILQKNSKEKILKIIILSTFIVLSCIYALTFILNLDFKNADNEFYNENEIIDTRNQVSRYSSFLEYWPQKAIDSINYIVDRDDKVSLISGNATIKNETKENGILSFYISNVQENTSLELPYLFYKGYQISYTSEQTNTKVILEAVESDKGLVQVNLNSDIKGNINVEYHITTLHKICIIISFTTIVLYLIVILWKKVKK